MSFIDEKGFVYDDDGNYQGRWLPADTAMWADRILEAEKKGGPWSAIEQMIECFKAQQPKVYESTLVDITELKESRASSTGASRNKSMRYLSSIPSQVWNMIVTFYGDKQNIDIYDKKFFREFAKRFPEFSVAEKI